MKYIQITLLLLLCVNVDAQPRTGYWLGDTTQVINLTEWPPENAYKIVNYMLTNPIETFQIRGDTLPEPDVTFGTLVIGTHDTIVPPIFRSLTSYPYTYAEAKPDTIQGISVFVVDWEEATIGFQFGYRVSIETLKLQPFYHKAIETTYYDAVGNVVPNVVWFINKQ